MANSKEEKELRDLAKKTSKVAQKKTFEQIYEDTQKNYMKTQEIVDKLTKKVEQLNSEIEKLKFKQRERIKLINRYNKKDSYFLDD